jgi:hypothetical protein
LRLSPVSVFGTPNQAAKFSIIAESKRQGTGAPPAPKILLLVLKCKEDEPRAITFFPQISNFY